MRRGIPDEPTSEQCSANAEVAFDGLRCFATWYPQMGGYVGKCVVVPLEVAGDEPPCFDVYVWHDGEFPFSDSGQAPKHLHHCGAEQFMNFGDTVRQRIRELGYDGGSASDTRGAEVITSQDELAKAVGGAEPYRLERVSELDRLRAIEAAAKKVIEGGSVGNDFADCVFCGATSGHDPGCDWAELERLVKA